MSDSPSCGKAVAITASTIAGACGPLMVFVGIALAITPSDRPFRLDDYNHAVNEYNAANPAAISGAIDPATSRAQVYFPFANKTEAIKADKITTGVDDATSTFLRATVQYNPTNMTTVGTRFGLKDSTIVRAPPLYTTKVDYAVCEKDEGCTVAEMRTYCQTTYDVGAQFTGKNPCPKGKCDECGYPAFLTDICIVVEKQDDGTYADSATMKSCYYPFKATTAFYSKKRPDGRSVPTYTATVRRSDDPFLAIQRITEGTMDFGPDSSSDMRGGVGLIVVGGVFTFLLLIMVAFWAKAYTAAQLASPEDAVKDAVDKIVGTEMKKVLPVEVTGGANNFLANVAASSNEPSA